MKFSMNIKKLNEKATVPTYGSEYAAGADLYACEGGEVTLYEEKRDFKTYKVTYTGDKVRINV